MRLNTRKIKQMDSPCHIWTGGKNTSGHGTVMFKGIRHYVHRVSYVDANGPIPRGCDIHHICCNPSCVNPNHLVAATRAQHMGFHSEPNRHAPIECKRGHKGEYKKNSQNRWFCDACRKQADARYYDSKGKLLRKNNMKY